MGVPPAPRTSKVTIAHGLERPTWLHPVSSGKLMSSTLAPVAFEANDDDNALLSAVSSEEPFSRTATLSDSDAFGSKSVWNAWVICPESVDGAGGIVGIVGDVGDVVVGDVGDVVVGDVAPPPLVEL